MSIAARFYVSRVSRFPAFNGTTNGWASPAPQIEVEMSVVTGGRAPENASWASATPSGRITMTVGNPEAAAWFDSMLGRDIAVTFDARPAEG